VQNYEKCDYISHAAQRVCLLAAGRQLIDVTKLLVSTFLPSAITE